MSRYQLDAEDLAKLTVTSSLGPFSESLFSLRLVHQRGTGDLVNGWRRRTSGRLDRTMMPLLAVTSVAPFVDLHTVAGPAATLDEALDQLHRASTEHLASELAPLRAHATHGPAWVRRWVRDLSKGEPAARRELAGLVRRYHGSAVEPHWGPVLAYLEAELARLGQVMRAQGVGALLSALHPTIRWRPPFLDVDVGRPADHTDADHASDPDYVLAGRSMVVVPSVFRVSRPCVLRNHLDEVAPDVLIYPALRRIGDAASLWTRAIPNGHRALERLLGPTRARTLEAIATAGTCTTTDLARRLGVAPATISHHVSALRDNGLIHSTRSGTTVLHRLTRLGTDLLDGNPSNLGHR